MNKNLLLIIAITIAVHFVYAVRSDNKLSATKVAIIQDSTITKNKIYYNGKYYYCTSEYELARFSDYNVYSGRYNQDYGNKFSIIIAKNGNSGLLIVSGGSPISGNTTLLLKGEKAITCVYRNNCKRLNNKETAVFFLTASEIGLLKEHNLAEMIVNTVYGAFTVSNMYERSGLKQSSWDKEKLEDYYEYFSYDINSAVTDLFSN